MELETGKILWTYKSENQIMGSPNYYSTGNLSVIIVGSYDYCLHGVDAKTGKGLWKYEANNYINGTPSVYKGMAVFGGCDGMLHMVNATNGKLVKRLTLASYIAGSVSVDDGKAYLGDYDGKFSCLDLNSMKVLWSLKIRPQNRHLLPPRRFPPPAYLSGTRIEVYVLFR
ncbi:MAG: PQQ-like beta-propeller repeat protein [Bacteroidales bacterium]|nr:PQQ-like beta-propeller repeat protein [Bacteroidales bacterium]